MNRALLRVASLGYLWALGSFAAWAASNRPVFFDSMTVGIFVGGAALVVREVIHDDEHQ